MNDTLPAALTFGFLGSLHCAGMCGGFVGALCMNRRNSMWARLLFYQSGRITTYVVLGLLVGILGVRLQQTGIYGFQTMMAVFAGMIMTAGGLNLLGLIPDPLARWTARVIKFIKIGNRANTLAQSRAFSPWFGAGVINGLLPCGLVYAALAMALTSKTLPAAASIMGLFGMGTMPVMMLVPGTIRLARPGFRNKVLQVTGTLMILYGIFTAMRAIDMPSFMHDSLHGHYISQLDIQNELCGGNNKGRGH